MEIYSSTSPSDEMNRLLNGCSANAINKPFINKWFKTIRRFSTFKDNEEYVRALKEILSVPVREIHEFEKQIQPNWLRKNKFIIDI
jgi:hypothetical protein